MSKRSSDYHPHVLERLPQGRSALDQAEWNALEMQLGHKLALLALRGVKAPDFAQAFYAYREQILGRLEQAQLTGTPAAMAGAIDDIRAGRLR